jgi:hypothetical protein
MKAAISRDTTAWSLALLLIFLLPGLALVLVDFNFSNPASASQDQFQLLPTFHQFAKQWPHFDLKNYYSPAAPGYFILVGTVQRFISANIVFLRTFNLLLSAGFVATFIAIATRYLPTPVAVLLAAPLVVSDTLLTRAVWLNTDNPAWWCVIGIFAIALNPALRSRAFVLTAIFAFLLVGTRQIHIWTLPVLLIAAFLTERPAPKILRMGLAITPALILVATLIFIWGNLVPPAFQTRRPGLSFSAIPMTFSLFALFGPFYATAVWSSVKDAWLNERARAIRFTTAGLMAGFCAGLTPDATFLPYYRANGIWQLARRHLIPGHSPAIFLLSLTGGLVIASLLLVLSTRDRKIFGSAIACLILIHCSNRAAFEQYYEPFVLIVLTFANARILAARMLKPSQWKTAAAGPALLAIIQAGYTVIQFSTPR